jgi:hypothetical protein
MSQASMDAARLASGLARLLSSFGVYEGPTGSADPSWRCRRAGAIVLRGAFLFADSMSRRRARIAGNSALQL